MSKKEELKANIRKYYLLSVFKNIAFFVPVFVIFLQDNGLSLAKVAFLQALYSIAIVLLEVPTGYIADVFGRRASLKVGFIFMVLATLMYGLGENFFQFLLAEMIWAVSTSLISGADTAFLWDTLVELGQESRFKKFQGNAVFYGMITMGLASILGSIIASHDLRYIWWASAPFFIAGAIITFTLRSSRKHKKVVKKGYFLDVLKVLHESAKRPRLRWLLLFSGIVLAFSSSMWLFYQPYFVISGLDIAYFGIVFAGLTVISALSSKYAHELERFLGMKASLILISLFAVIGYLLFSKFVFIFGFLFAILFEFANSYGGILVSDYINKLTSSDVRATVLSASSLIRNLTFALILPIFGWISDIYTLTFALLIMGVTLGVVSLFLILMLIKVDVI